MQPAFFIVALLFNTVQLPWHGTYLQKSEYSSGILERELEDIDELLERAFAGQRSLCKVAAVDAELHEVLSARRDLELLEVVDEDSLSAVGNLRRGGLLELLCDLFVGDLVLNTHYTELSRMSHSRPEMRVVIVKMSHDKSRKATANEAVGTRRISLTQ